MANTKSVVESADLAICHLETALAPDEGPFSAIPVRIPAADHRRPQADRLRLLHHGQQPHLDAGADGIDRTLNKLDQDGIGHTGSARSQAEADTPSITTVNTANGPVKVGNLAYAFGFNGLDYPDGQTWRANKIDVPTILAKAKQLRADGADVVILNMHWGTEYQAQPDAESSSTGRSNDRLARHRHHPRRPRPCRAAHHQRQQQVGGLRNRQHVRLPP